MLYNIKVTGTQPIIMHSGSGIDSSTEINLEVAQITKKRGSNRTAADDARLKQLETLKSFWLDNSGNVTIPPQALRANIEGAARKLKQGPQVREGLVVLDSVFNYDKERYGESLEDLSLSTQFTVPVVVQRNRIMRTRAMFDLDWSATFKVDVDDELVDQIQLETWLDIGGRRLGLGDWRPEKSGMYGRYTAEVSLVN